MDTTIFQCPTCRNDRLAMSGDRLECVECHTVYDIHGGIQSLVPPRAQDDVFKQAMHSFWGGGWEKRGSDDKSVASKEKLLLEIGTMRFLADLYEGNQMREMVFIPLEGKRVLEIGCGAGNSSIMLALRGAHVVASDLTEGAVAVTHHKFQLLGINGSVVQADAEHLPFRDESFDVVYSSGVLHHTPNIEQAVQHIYRVLKPGGHVVVMLYARWSFYYIVSLLFIQGILLGGIWCYGFKQWLGNITEKGWHTNSKQLNPLTRVYSAREMKKLFKDFTILSFRKCGFNWADIIPGIYRIIPRHTFGVGDVKAIVPSALERMIGRWAGFALTVHVRKPDKIL